MSIRSALVIVVATLVAMPARSDDYQQLIQRKSDPGLWKDIQEGKEVEAVLILEADALMERQGRRLADRLRQLESAAALLGRVPAERQVSEEHRRQNELARREFDTLKRRLLSDPALRSLTVVDWLDHTPTLLVRIGDAAAFLALLSEPLTKGVRELKRLKPASSAVPDLAGQSAAQASGQAGASTRIGAWQPSVPRAPSGSAADLRGRAVDANPAPHRRSPPPAVPAR